MNRDDRETRPIPAKDYDPFCPKCRGEQDDWLNATMREQDDRLSATFREQDSAALRELAVPLPQQREEDDWLNATLRELSAPVPDRLCEAHALNPSVKPPDPLK